MNKNLKNTFVLFGIAKTNFVGQKDAKGKVNYTNIISTDEQYPVELRIHFYNPSIEMLETTYLSHKVKIFGSIQGKMYSNKSNSLITREWVQLRGTAIYLINFAKEEEIIDMDNAIISEDDLPY
ncbi:MAG: hypothetical protein ACI4PF_02225 [Christensenellales bacterium]